MKKFSHKSLQKFITQIFLALGCTISHATMAANVLITANLFGIDSHGITRLKGYVDLWNKNHIKSNPDFSIIHETPSTAVLDADQGLGLVIAQEAMHIAIEKAHKVGTGWVAVNNSTHYGMAGFHAMLALKKDMIGMVMTNTGPWVAPPKGIERLLGTNPLAVAIPAGKQPPFIADFSTTNVANGKVITHQQEQKKIPKDWILDAQGKPTQNPQDLQKGGSLLPLGSIGAQSTHKGYALGAIIDIFSGVLSGANYGPWVPPFFRPLSNETSTKTVGKGTGHFLGAMRIDAFRSAEMFKKHMDQWIECFRNTKPHNHQQPVLIPGDLERACMAQRIKEGIPLPSTVIAQLQSLALQLNIPFTLLS